MDLERLVAWNLELQTVHHRLEDALRTARTAAGVSVLDEVLLHCHGFCAALTAHHTGEDAALFPRLLADHPELRPVVRRLAAEHEVLAALVGQFEDVLRRGDGSGHRALLDRRLDELQAAMTAHFAYEERELDRALDDLQVAPTEATSLLG